MQIGLRTVHWKVGLFPVPGMVRMGVTSPRSYWQPEQIGRKETTESKPPLGGKEDEILILSKQIGKTSETPNFFFFRMEGKEREDLFCQKTVCSFQAHSEERERNEGNLGAFRFPI